MEGTRQSTMILLLTFANVGRLAERRSEMRRAALYVGQLLAFQAEDLVPAELAYTSAWSLAEGPIASGGGIHAFEAKALVSALTRLQDPVDVFHDSSILGEIGVAEEAA